MVKRPTARAARDFLCAVFASEAGGLLFVVRLWNVTVGDRGVCLTSWAYKLWLSLEKGMSKDE